MAAMETKQQIIPIYTTRGDVRAYLIYPYVFNVSGDWIAWVRPDKSVFSIYGNYVGWLSSDPRILSRLAESYSRPRQSPPKAPEKPRLPVSSKLPPLMPELAFGIFDVLEDRPDLLPCADFGDQLQDMD